jgi:hypothetical protein
MTQRGQDIDDLKGQKVQDIDDSTHRIYNLILQKQYLPKGGIRWNKILEKQPLNAI